MNSTSQTTSTGNRGPRNRRTSPPFGHWSLGLLWSLCVEIWNFSAHRTDTPHPRIGVSITRRRLRSIFGERETRDENPISFRAPPAAHGQRGKRETVHEFSVAKSLVDLVLTHAAKQDPPSERVLKARVVVGAMRQIVPDYLQFAYEVLTRGTPAEGSSLEITERTASGRCKSCGRVHEMSGLRNARSGGAARAGAVP
jgi:hydrogenase nickel incorporation protein HypA/HybF